MLREEVAPSARYLHLIQDGAEESSLDQAYQVMESFVVTCTCCYVGSSGCTAALRQTGSASQAWLRDLEHAPFTGRGFGPEYYDCPQKSYDRAAGVLIALALSALLVHAL